MPRAKYDSVNMDTSEGLAQRPKFTITRRAAITWSSLPLEGGSLITATPKLVLLMASVRQNRRQINGKMSFSLLLHEKMMSFAWTKLVIQSLEDSTCTPVSLDHTYPLVIARGKRLPESCFSVKIYKPWCFSGPRGLCCHVYEGRETLYKVL